MLRLEIARLLRIQREQQLAECSGLVFQALVSYIYVKSKFFIIRFFLEILQTTKSSS